MSESVSAFLASILGAVDRFVRRVTAGRHTATKWVGRLMVEVETIGACSGRRRTPFSVGIRQGETIVVVGSNFGRPPHPAWAHNLRAHPECCVRVGG